MKTEKQLVAEIKKYTLLADKARKELKALYQPYGTDTTTSQVLEAARKLKKNKFTVEELATSSGLNKRFIGVVCRQKTKDFVWVGNNTFIKIK